MTERAGTGARGATRLRLLEFAPLLLGAGALAIGTASGWDARVLVAIATPPPIVRLALAGAALIVAVLLLGAAVGRIEAGSTGTSGSPGASGSSGSAGSAGVSGPAGSSGSAALAGSGGGHLVDLLRGVRLAFLSVAALAVAAGWLIGHPLPFVVALIIAGIDVVETSFLLIVVRRDPS